MTRIAAILAGLAGLTAMGAQGVVRLITMRGQPSEAELVPLIFQIGQWSQLAFVALMTIFLFLFALTKRSAA